MSKIRTAKERKNIKYEFFPYHHSAVSERLITDLLHVNNNLCMLTCVILLVFCDVLRNDFFEFLKIIFKTVNLILFLAQKLKGKKLFTRALIS